MARYKRIYSQTGIYHIMDRGNNKKDIFIDNYDKIKYLDILEEKRGDFNFTLYAYCIMTNHCHLIIKEENEYLPDIMKKINTSYAMYFNKKYGQIGHVFQGRYKSEPIEDDNYLLAAVRYVHNNPIEAKLVNIPEDYPWSSYNDYIGKTNGNLVDKDFILSLFSKEIGKSIGLFKEFSQKSNKDSFIDLLYNKKEEAEIKGYHEAEKYIGKFLELENLKLKDLKRRDIIDRRNELILYLRKNSDLTIRDISKLLDIGRGTVGNVKELGQGTDSCPKG